MLPIWLPGIECCSRDRAPISAYCCAYVALCVDFSGRRVFIWLDVPGDAWEIVLFDCLEYCGAWDALRALFVQFSGECLSRLENFKRVYQHLFAM